MGNHAGKRELNTEKASTNGETNRGESEKKTNLGELSRTTSEDSEVFGEADANQNNGTSSQDTAVTDSKRTADPKNAWQDAHPADPGSRPHLIRLFSRDAPGREDNTFKDRPSESDELQTIQEDSAATSESLDVMASQKRPSQRHGSKYLATASTMDHARHGFLPRHRDTGILDSIGRFFGGDRGVPKRGSGKDSHHAARTAHYGSLPQKSHGRTQDENPVVHFFKNIVTPRTPPPSQGKVRPWNVLISHHFTDRPSLKSRNVPKRELGSELPEFIPKRVALRLPSRTGRQIHAPSCLSHGCTAAGALSLQPPRSSGWNLFLPPQLYRAFIVFPVY
uniref:Myelin basic protein n=1 Tax=Macaca mulatta TaxID=9544 RepID=A0A1D5RDL7_MACMU